MVLPEPIGDDLARRSARRSRALPSRPSDDEAVEGRVAARGGAEQLAPAPPLPADGLGRRRERRQPERDGGEAQRRRERREDRAPAQCRPAREQRLHVLRWSRRSGRLRSTRSRLGAGSRPTAAANSSRSVTPSVRTSRAVARSGRSSAARWAGIAQQRGQAADDAARAARRGRGPRRPAGASRRARARRRRRRRRRRRAATCGHASADGVGQFRPAMTELEVAVDRDRRVRPAPRPARRRRRSARGPTSRGRSPGRRAEVAGGGGGQRAHADGDDDEVHRPAVELRVELGEDRRVALDDAPRGSPRSRATRCRR